MVLWSTTMSWVTYIIRTTCSNDWILIYNNSDCGSLSERLYWPIKEVRREKQIDFSWKMGSSSAIAHSPGVTVVWCKTLNTTH